jgi:hypothetical protein
MKRIFGIGAIGMGLCGTAAATDLGLSYDLSNILAPAGASTSMGASYYLDDSSEIQVGLDMSLMDGAFALSSVDIGYLMHGDGDGIHSLMGGGVTITDATGDMGISIGGGVGFQSDLGFFDNASVRGFTGLSVAVLPDVMVMSMSSNLQLHYKFGL